MSDQDLIAELCDVGSGLSEWEADFVGDLANWLKTHDSLTAKQRAKALEIYEAAS